MSVLETLDDLEAALEDGSLGQSDVLELWEEERDKKNRKGALELLGDAIASQKDEEDHTALVLLESEVDELKKKLASSQKKLKKAQEAPAPIAAAPVAAPDPIVRKSGRSFSDNAGVFVIAPLREIERWEQMSRITRFVVDVTGEAAERLAGQYPHEYVHLADGTIRINCASIRIARVLENKLQNAARMHDVEIGIDVHSMGTSATLVKDSVRGQSVNFIREMCVIGSKEGVKLSSLEKDSEICGIEISW